MQLWSNLYKHHSFAQITTFFFPTLIAHSLRSIISHSQAQRSTRRVFQHKRPRSSSSHRAPALHTGIYLSARPFHHLETMSYVFDPTTGLVQWVSNISINPYPHDASHGIYGGTYGSNEEYEVLRQQTAEQRDFSGYTYGPHSPAGTCSHRVSDSDHSSTSRRFPARIGSLSGSPQLRNSQRNTTTPDRQNEHSNSNHSMGGHYHPGRGNSVPHRYHDGLRSKEDLIEELVARIGPAGYVS